MIKPMLAHKYIDAKNKRFPYLIQRKYNGIRCMIEYNIYTIGEGLFASEMPSVKMFSKEGKEYLVDHIWDFFANKVYADNAWKSIVFDGELYIHGEPLNMIKSRVPMFLTGGKLTETRYSPDDLTYVIFDIYDRDNPSMNQIERLDTLRAIYEEYMFDNCELGSIIVSDVDTVNNEEEAYRFRDKYISEGYEGAMLRSFSNKYQQKRSWDLLKLKKRKETECIILDIIDDGFKSDRETIAFILRNDMNDETFKCTPGDTDNSWNNEYKRWVYNNKKDFIGKKATVVFFERSGVKKVPFHANVTVIRNYE